MKKLKEMMRRTNRRYILIFPRVAIKLVTRHQLLMARIPVILIAHHIANGQTSIV